MKMLKILRLMVPSSFKKNQIFGIAWHTIISMNKWVRTKRKCAKWYWITNKTLIFNIIALPKMFHGKTKSEKNLVQNFFCFPLSPFLFKLKSIIKYSKTWKQAQVHVERMYGFNELLCLSRQVFFNKLNLLEIAVNNKHG